MRFAVLPPHVLEAMRHHPDVRVRDSARRALIVGRTLRARPAPLRPAEATGRIGGPHPLVRRIFSCAWSATVPGVLMRVEGQPPCDDAETNRAFDAAGAVHAFWCDVFERDSIDGRGMHLVGSVHYRNDYDNAFWDGAQMVYGDGNGVVIAGYTTSIDITGHELAHGMLHSGETLSIEGRRGR